jgi:hypothetical protein
MRHLLSSTYSKSLPNSNTVSLTSHDLNFFVQFISIDAKAAAKTLGYDQKIWDKDEDTVASEKDWKDLSSKEKEAAATLGYDEAVWNAHDN